MATTTYVQFQERPPADPVSSGTKLLNSMATDFLSDTLYVRSCVGEHVYQALSSINSDIRDNKVHVFFKGGLALNALMSDVRDILNADENLMIPNFRKFFGIAEKYMKTSDFDSTIMICEKSEARFNTALNSVAGICKTYMKRLSSTMKREIRTISAAATAYFTAKHDEVVKILVGMNRPVRSGKQYDLVLTLADAPDVQVQFEYDMSKCPAGSRPPKCLRISRFPNHSKFLYFSDNRAIEFTNDRGRTMSFILLRVKCAFMMRVYDSTTGSEVDSIVVNGEVMDVSIPLFRDTGRFDFMNHRHHRNIKTYVRSVTSPSCSLGDVPVPCADLQYIMDDLEFAMHDFADSKSPKRQMRYWILTKLKQLVYASSKRGAVPPPSSFANSAVDAFGAMNARSFLGFTSYSDEFLRDIKEVSNARLFADSRPIGSAARSKLRNFFSHLTHANALAKSQPALPKMGGSRTHFSRKEMR